MIYTANADGEVYQLTFTDDAGGLVDLSGSTATSASTTADVVATALSVNTQPADIISGVSMTEPIVHYVDADGTIDTGVDNDILTASESSDGSITAVSTTSASNGVADFDEMICASYAERE